MWLNGVNFNYCLKQLEEHFSKLGIYLKIGAELEFYLQGEADVCADAVCEIAKHCFRVEKEKGWNQFECVFDHEVVHAEKVVENILHIKSIINFYGRKYGLFPTLKAKPFENDYGSGMHFHISLHNKSGDNLFASGAIDENQMLNNSVAGILEFSSLAPYVMGLIKEDYKRFHAGYMVPTNISWGGNNRSTLIRIPEGKPEVRRIEYRLPPSSADPAKALFICLLGVAYGISEKLEPISRVYGNAFDFHYDFLEKLPTSPEDAEKCFVQKKDVFKQCMKSFAKTIP